MADISNDPRNARLGPPVTRPFNSRDLGPHTVIGDAAAAPLSAAGCGDPARSMQQLFVPPPEVLRDRAGEDKNKE